MRAKTYIVECFGYRGRKHVDKTVRVVCRNERNVTEVAMWEATDRDPKFTCNSFKVWDIPSARREMRRLARAAAKLNKLIGE